MKWLKKEEVRKISWELYREDIKWERVKFEGDNNNQDDKKDNQKSQEVDKNDNQKGGDIGGEGFEGSENNINIELEYIPVFSKKEKIVTLVKNKKYRKGKK